VQRGREKVFATELFTPVYIFAASAFASANPLLVVVCITLISSFTPRPAVLMLILLRFLPNAVLVGVDGRQANHTLLAISFAGAPSAQHAHHTAHNLDRLQTRRISLCVELTRRKFNNDRPTSKCEIWLVITHILLYQVYIVEPGGFCACSAISPLALNWVLVILLTLRAVAFKTRVHFSSCQQQSVVFSSAECWRQSAFFNITFVLTMQSML